MHRDHEVLHGRTCVAGFAVAVREELDRGDVAVGIRDAAGHQRAGIGLRCRQLAQLGYRPDHRGGKQHDPRHERQQQPGVKLPQHHRARQEIDGDVGGHVGEGHHHLAHGQRRLHHLGRHAASELVLIEAQALSQHQPVKAPAQPHRQHALQRLEAQRRRHQHQQRAQHQHHAHDRQRAAFFGPQRLGRVAADPVHHEAHPLEQQRLQHADARHRQEQQHQPAPHALKRREHEAPQASFGDQSCFIRIRVDPAFEPMEEGFHAWGRDEVFSTFYPPRCEVSALPMAAVTVSAMAHHCVSVSSSPSTSMATTEVSAGSRLVITP